MDLMVFMKVWSRSVKFGGIFGVYEGRMLEKELCQMHDIRERIMNKGTSKLGDDET